MKLMTLFMLVIIGAASAHGYSQPVELSLNLSNVTISQVFMEIEKNSDFILIYNEKELNINRQVSVKAENESIETVLRQVLDGTGNYFNIYDRQIVIFKLNEIPVSDIIGNIDIQQPQKKVITGTITDENGNPLPGVNVQVEGTTVGAISDAGGKYSIDIPNDNAVLVFSFIGYNTQRIPVSGKTTIDMRLVPGVASLEEVVVVGYGEQSRSILTNSIAKLNDQVLSNVPRANVGSALQGTLSGLRVVNATGTPGATPNILLRGGASINSPGAPLVVVDGVIRAINDISPEDLASVEVLKDAASTAIYGARANNGVILITTKQGKTGKSEITYKVTSGYNEKREGYKYMNAKDFIYYARLGNLNSGITLAAANNTRGLGLQTDPASLATFDIRAYNSSNDYLLAEGWDTVGDPYGGKIIFKDHGGEVENIVFRNTKTIDHYLNVSGGNDIGKYFASFNYYNEDGIIVGSSYKRYTGVINGSYKVKPNVEVTTGVNLSSSAQLGVNGSEVNNIYRNLSIWPTFNPWLDEAKTKPNPGNGTNDGNPLYWLGKLKRSNEVSGITTNASVKWDILPDLYIKASGNAYLSERLNESFQESTQTYANIFANPPSYSSTSRASQSAFARDFQTQFNTIINYSKTIVQKHNFSMMLGGEYFDVKSFEQRTLGTNAPTDDIPTANASTTFAAGSNYSSKSEYRLISALGRINYNFNQKYLLNLVARRDGVSSLPEKNRFGFFPGMSAGWNMHREAFFTNLGLNKFLSTLKPRISYGLNGNVTGLGRYEVQGVYSSQGLYNGSAGFLNSTLINNELRWEKSKTTDIGVDLGIINDRVSIIFDYFSRETSDLLTNLELPGYVGFSSIRTNLGNFQNKGYEFDLRANIFRLPNGLMLDISGNASFVKNIIKKLPYNGNDKNRQGGIQVFDPKTNKVVWVGGLQEGETMGVIYGYKQVSIFKDAAEVAEIAGTRYDAIANITGPNLSYGAGKITEGDVNWADIDRNDTIDTRDQVYLGNINPKWTGGFTLNLSYKGFSLYSQFEFALGHTIYNDYLARVSGIYQGTFNFFDISKDAWSPTNRVTDIPKIYSADQRVAPQGKKNYTRGNNANAVLNGNNSHYYEPGDYLACREITLSYDFSKELLARTKVLSALRIFASANNMFYLTKFSGLSPEPPSSGGNITGVHAGTYPTPRSYIMGIKVSF